MAVTPNMQLPLDTVSVESGPQWAADLETMKNLIDQHDHSAGRGATVTPDGMMIDATLPMNSNALTQVGYLTLIQASPAPTAVLSVYSDGTDLWYLDGNNNKIQITSHGSASGTAVNWLQLLDAAGTPAVGSIYALSGDLYFVNGSGTVQRLTDAGGVYQGQAVLGTSILAVPAGNAIGASDQYSLYIVTAGTTVALPPVSGVQVGRSFVIKNAMTVAATVSAAGTDTIDLAASYTLAPLGTGSAVRLAVGQAGAWYIVGKA